MKKELSKMKTISIKIPSLLEIEQREIQEVIAVVFYNQKRVSEYRACQMIGISRREFEEILPKYGFSILANDQKTIDTEIEMQ